MSKRVLIDIDGTVADWEQKFIDLMTEHHPHIPLLPHGTRTYADRHKEEHIRAMPETQQVLAMPGFYGTLNWYPKAKEALLNLQKEGHDIYFCSMPSRTNLTSANEKLIWIAQTLGEEWVERVILTFRKDLVDADVLIDDHVQPKTAHTKWTQLLYTQSYNQHITDIERVNGWDDYETLSETIRNA